MSLLTAEIPGAPLKSSSLEVVTGSALWSMGIVVVMPSTDEFDHSVQVMLQQYSWNNKSIVSCSACCIYFFNLSLIVKLCRWATQMAFVAVNCMSPDNGCLLHLFFQSFISC